jgi:hypothetical protein
MTESRIERLASTPRTLAHLVVDASDDLLDAEPGPGAWSVRTVMARLRDDEFLCMRLCVERALAETEPEVTFLEGSDWVASRRRGRDRKEQILADFALQRSASVAILRSLGDEDWGRAVRDRRRGRLTISDLVDIWIRHSDEHLAQVERLLGETLAEVQARRAAWAAAYPRPPQS